AKHHIVPLPTNFETAWNAFHSSHRQHTRRGMNAGLVARQLVGEEAIDVFYALHSEVRKFKFGLMPQSRGFFENIATTFFPDRGFVFTTEYQGKVVAALFFLALGKTLYYKFGASSLSDLDVRPNNFLFTKAIEYAVERGFTHLDLGISDTDGLIRFKERMGGIASSVFTSSYNPREKSAAVMQVEQAFGDVTKLLTAPELPISAAQKGGEIFYRFFT
ncbi:MAG: GNAT family N-acetyltransferase, partial [Candidatus Aquilonibacter sp.]